MIFGKLDSQLLEITQHLSNPLFDLIFKAISFLGNPIFWITIACILYWSGRERKSIFLFNLITLTSAFIAILKLTFAIPRPSPDKYKVVEESRFIFDINNANKIDYSFPSGHSALATSIAYAILKNLSIILAVVFTLLVGFSRIYLGKHFPSDVIGGILVGLIIGYLNEKLYKRFEKIEFNKDKRSNEVMFAILIAILFGAVILIDTPIMALLVISFYTGFFLSRIFGINQKKLDGFKLILKQSFGLFVLLLMFLFVILFKIDQNLIGLTSGLWISFILPYISKYLFEK